MRHTKKQIYEHPLTDPSLAFALGHIGLYRTYAPFMVALARDERRDHFFEDRATVVRTIEDVLDELGEVIRDAADNLQALRARYDGLPDFDMLQGDIRDVTTDAAQAGYLGELVAATEIAALVARVHLGQPTQTLAYRQIVAELSRVAPERMPEVLETARRVLTLSTPFAKRGTPDDVRIRFCEQDGAATPTVEVVYHRDGAAVSAA